MRIMIKFQKDAVQQDLRQLGIFMALAGVVGFFIEPATVTSLIVLAMGVAAWLCGVLHIKTKPSGG